MKFFIIFLLLLFSINTHAQERKNNSIIGKWKLVAEGGSTGANVYSNEIKNGEILIFESENKIKNGKGKKGTYELHDDKLKIKLNREERYYLLSYDENKSNIIYFNPATPKYQIICDEGCAFTYKKL